MLIKSVMGKQEHETEFLFAGKQASDRDRRIVLDVHGQARRWRFDVAWPAHRIALEIEGGVWVQGRHTRGKGYIDDMTKYNTATLLGWRVFRCTPATASRVAALELIKRAMEQDD